MLTHEEKQALYAVIAHAIGDDLHIRSYAHLFNERTIDVVEEMLSASATCNEDMRTLVAELIGAATVATKGWLRKVIKGTKRAILASDVRGYGCAMSVKSRWRTAIVTSTV
jgi:hypothetical protein